MQLSEPITHVHERDVSSSGVSWGAVVGGAFVAAALLLIMLALGAGFGLSAVSPWSNVGVTASTAGSMAILWLILIDVVAFSMGGYLTGRLRTKWHGIHNDEVHFRDTANGFVAWAVAIVVTVAFLGAASASMTGTGGQHGAVESREALGLAESAPAAYFVDRLFRSDRPTAETESALRAEAGRIFVRALLPGAPSADITHLAQLVAAKTGLTPSDAENRVSATLADARQAEDVARKATAHLLLWIFLALLIGAFFASYAATIGGRQRDHVKLI